MTTDPISPAAELPQPPREPLDTPYARDLAGETPSDPRYDSYVEMAEDRSEPDQEGPEASQVELGTKRLNLTSAKMIEDRLRVMEERFSSYRALLAGFGVGEGVELRGLKLRLQETLRSIDNAHDNVIEAHHVASDVVDTLESL